MYTSRSNSAWQCAGICSGVILIVAGIVMLIIGALMLADQIIPGGKTISSFNAVAIALVVLGCLFIVAGIVLIIVAMCCCSEIMGNSSYNNVRRIDPYGNRPIITTNYPDRPIIQTNYPTRPVIQTNYAEPTYYAPQPVIPAQNVTVTHQYPQTYSTGPVSYRTY